MPAPQSKTSPPISGTLQEPQSRQVEAHCERHGAYVSTETTYYLFDKPSVHATGCPKCSAEREAKRLAQSQAEAASERAFKVAQLKSEARIPLRFAGSEFASYWAVEQGQKVALSVCKAYAEKWPERIAAGASLVLTGLPGTGKTHLACAVGNAVMEGHVASVLFCTVSTALRAIKETYRKGSERGEQDVINKLTRPDLLILDEVGVQVGSEHEKLLMFEILNERYQDMRPTILISNLSITELEDFLGQRVMDRYRECGSVLAFDWQSHRGQR